MKRETVGKLATDLSKKEPDTRDPIELEREMHKDYEKNLYACIERATKDSSIHGDFYVVVETKKERLLPNVLRNYFFYRKTCPTPTTDQTVYRYNAAHEVLEFLWVVPSEDTCRLLRNNVLEVAPEEKDLLHFVLDFYDGVLLRRAQSLNGEYISPIVEH